MKDIYISNIVLEEKAGEIYLDELITKTTDLYEEGIEYDVFDSIEIKKHLNDSSIYYTIISRDKLNYSSITFEEEKEDYLLKVESCVLAIVSDIDFKDGKWIHLNKSVNKEEHFKEVIEIYRSIIKDKIIRIVV